MAQFLRFNFKY